MCPVVKRSFFLDFFFCFFVPTLALASLASEVRKNENMMNGKLMNKWMTEGEVVRRKEGSKCKTGKKRRM